MIRTSVALLTVGLGLAAEAGGQVVRGRIVEDGPNRPVTHADIILLDEEHRALASTQTDSLGRFVFEVSEGYYAFRAGGLGFMTVTTAVIEVGPDEELQVRIVLSPKAILLAPLEITARSRPLISGMMMQAYNERRVKNLGFAITRKQIEERNPRRVTDLLQMVPGVIVIPQFGGSAIEIPGSGRRFVPGCQVKVMLDGLLFRWGATTIDDIPVDDVEAIEVFRNLAEIPPEMGGPDAVCGVVAVWTKRGRD